MSVYASSAVMLKHRQDVSLMPEADIVQDAFRAQHRLPPGWQKLKISTGPASPAQGAN